MLQSRVYQMGDSRSAELLPCLRIGRTEQVGACFVIWLVAQILFPLRESEVGYQAGAGLLNEVIGVEKLAVEPKAQSGRHVAVLRHRGNSAEEGAVVRAKHHRYDGALMRETEDLFACRNFEDSGCFVVAPGGEPPAVGAERNRRNNALMSKTQDFLPGGCFEHPRCIADIAAGNQLAVRAER